MAGGNDRIESFLATKREFLGTLASAGTAAVAGCSGGGGGTETQNGFSPEFGDLEFNQEYVRGDTVLFDEENTSIAGENIEKTELVIEYEENQDVINLSEFDGSYTLNSTGAAEAFLRAESTNGQTATSQKEEFNIEEVGIDAILEGESSLTLSEDQSTANIEYDVESNVDQEKIDSVFTIVQDGEGVETNGITEESGVITLDYNQLLEDVGAGEHQIRIGANTRGKEDYETVNINLQASNIGINAELETDNQQIAFGQDGEIAVEMDYILSAENEEDVEAGIYLEKGGDFTRQVYQIEEIEEGTQLVNFRDLAEATPNQEGEYSLVLKAEATGQNTQGTAQDNITAQITYDKAEKFLQQLDMLPNNEDIVEKDTILLYNMERMAEEFPQKVGENANFHRRVHNGEVGLSDFDSFTSDPGSTDSPQVGVYGYSDEIFESEDPGDAIVEGRDKVGEYEGVQIHDFGPLDGQVFYNPQNEVSVLVEGGNGRDLAKTMRGDMENLRGEMGLQYEDEKGVKRANNLLFDRERDIALIAGAHASANNLFADDGNYPGERDLQVQLWDPIDDEDGLAYESAVILGENGSYELKGLTDLITQEDSRFSESVSKEIAAREFNGI